MEFNEVIEKRFSVRKFSDEIVPQNLIEEILEIGRIAPSAGNLQPTIVYVLDEEKIELFNKFNSPQINSKQAFLICYNKNIEMKRPQDNFSFGITDSSIVTTFMMLKITELGLGSVWTGWFDSKKIKEILKIPEEYEVSVILPFGYKSKSYKQKEKSKTRKPMEEFRIEFD
jgi:nitroreductase